MMTRRTALGALAAAAATQAAPVTTRFNETFANFANPHRGLMTQQRAPGAKSTRLPLSVTYVRVDWAELEPREGDYNWALFDDAITAWKPAGVRLAFRIMTANAHSRGAYSSPKWLFDAGCKSFEYLVGGDDPTSGGVRIPRIEPDYSDPIYFLKHLKFLRALAGRYDSHPQMEFADIGSYGIWGEWHTTHPAPLEVRKRLVDLYTDNFHQLPLAFMSDDAEVLDYALSKGTGFRRDGVGSDWHAKNWIGSQKYAAVRGFDTAWRRAPAVFEWYGDWKYLKSRGWSFADSAKFMLDNHVTYINDNIGDVPEQDRQIVADLERKAGYRFVLREATQAVRGRDVDLRMLWSNVGVAPIYRNYGLEISLAHQDGSLRSRTIAADVRKWLPGDHTVNVTLNAEPGTYLVTAAILAPGEAPAIRLACDAPEQGLRYGLGVVTLT